jgi:hypothetical protein
MLTFFQLHGNKLYKNAGLISHHHEDVCAQAHICADNCAADRAADRTADRAADCAADCTPNRITNLVADCAPNRITNLVAEHSRSALTMCFVFTIGCSSHIAVESPYIC